MLLADLLQCAVAGDHAARERRVCGERHIPLGDDAQQPILGKERVVFDLVRQQRRDVERALEHAGREVGHTRMADLLLLQQLRERLQRALERDAAARPVEQQQVDVVGVEGAERLLGGTLELRRLRI